MGRKRLSLALISIMLFQQLRAVAADFVVNGLTFRVCSEKMRTAEVVRNDTLFYQGEVRVPEKVNNNGTNYTVTAIGDGAFLCCGQLTNVVLPTTLKRIADRAFYGCHQLSRCDFGQQVDSIGHYAFTDCWALTEISLPGTVAYIGRSAFKGCVGLKYIQADGTVPPILSGNGILSSFAGTDQTNIVVTVPTGCANRYHAAQGWSQFAHIIDHSATSDETLLSFAIEGAGHVLFVGGEAISGHTYTLPRGANAELIIKAEKDYLLKQVFVNGEARTSSLRGDTLSLPTLMENTLVQTFFVPCDTYLTLCHDENGSLEIDVAENRPVRLHIRPNAGWSIHKVTVDGADVTQDLGKDNTLMVEKAHRGMMIRVILEKNGQYAVWSANGLMTLHDATSPIVVPAEAVCADLTSCPQADIRPNENPNTLYVLSHTAETPHLLNDHNVVVDGHAERIRLTDGHEVFLPFDIQADEASYIRTPTLGTNGHGGWDTIILPFGVQQVTNLTNGEQIDWRHGPDDYGHRFWLRSLTGTNGQQAALFADVAQWEANKPYLIAVPSDTWGEFYDLRGHPLSFTAQQVTVHATRAMDSTKYPLTFHGTLAQQTVSGYVLNSTGNTFDYVTNAQVSPFHCYLTTEESDWPARIPVVTGTTDIQNPEAESEENASGTYYHINGVKMPKGKTMPHGIYIINGKKTIK